MKVKKKRETFEIKTAIIHNLYRVEMKLKKIYKFSFHSLQFKIILCLYFYIYFIVYILIFL